MLKLSILIVLALQQAFVNANPSHENVDNEFFADIAMCQLIVNDNKPFQELLVRFFDFAMMKQNLLPLEPNSMIDDLERACNCAEEGENDCLDQIDPRLLTSIKEIGKNLRNAKYYDLIFFLDPTILEITFDAFCDTEFQDHVFPIMSSEIYEIMKEYCQLDRDMEELISSGNIDYSSINPDLF